MSEDLRDEFYNGKSFTAYRYFGAHIIIKDNIEGVIFRVYAPKALKIEVIGEFNNWCGENHSMNKIDGGGIYELFVPEAKENMMYKYRVYQCDGNVCDKQDPYAFLTELRPNTASIIKRIDSYEFDDYNWMNSRDKNYNKPLNIYEVHFGSWRKKSDNNGDWFTYGELCRSLIEYVKNNNFTHIELMPLSEHPFDGSWGYQISGYLSVTARYGSVEELQYFINECHKNNIGIIIDFVPVHFTKDFYALSKFDGSNLYEYEPSDVTFSQWGSCNFNFYRKEVCSFVQSAANFWLDVLHADGLRMDAINNAIYWLGDEKRGINMGAVNFLKNLNKNLNEIHKGIMLIAEDSSNYPKVTAPVEYDGLGFDYKWDLGWMNDTLNYFKTPPEERKYHHHKLTFSMSYFYNELYLLPFSHDEVVHGKRTILDKMYGSYEEKFAQCKTLYMYMMTHPGKKLNFMGNEIGHFREWDESREMDWNLLSYPMHNSFNTYFKRLSQIYKESPCLYECEYDRQYFRWLDADNYEKGIYTYMRGECSQKFIIVLNTSSNYYEDLQIGYETKAKVIEILNSDETCYGGNGVVNEGIITTDNIAYNNFPHSFTIKLGAFSACILEVLE